jgi:hypothetical protein
VHQISTTFGRVLEAMGHLGRLQNAAQRRYGPKEASHAASTPIHQEIREGSTFMSNFFDWMKNRTTALLMLFLHKKGLEHPIFHV